MPPVARWGVEVELGPCRDAVLTTTHEDEAVRPENGHVPIEEVLADVVVAHLVGDLVPHGEGARETSGRGHDDLGALCLEQAE